MTQRPNTTQQWLRPSLYLMCSEEQQGIVASRPKSDHRPVLFRLVSLWFWFWPIRWSSLFGLEESRRPGFQYSISGAKLLHANCMNVVCFQRYSSNSIFRLNDLECKLFPLSTEIESTVQVFCYAPTINNRLDNTFRLS